MRPMFSICAVLMMAACVAPGSSVTTGENADATNTALAVPSGSGGGYVQAPTVGCYPSFGASSSVLLDGTVQFWNGVWNCPVSIEVGQAMSSIAVAVRDNGAVNGHADAPNVVSASLILQSSAGDALLMSATSAATGAQQTITMTTSSPHEMLPGEALVLRFMPTTTTTPPTFALWPSAIGAMRMLTTAPMPVYITIPSRLFSADTTGTLVSQLDLTPGSRIVAVSIAARCPDLGFLQSCVRIRESGTWSCGPATSCDSFATANKTMAPIVVDSSHHVDISIQGAPQPQSVSIATITVRP
jgi:hypothetical protein